MTLLHQAAQKAVEAIRHTLMTGLAHNDAIAALNELSALQQQPEPVARGVAELEQRYIVFKIKDVERLTQQQRDALYIVTSAVQQRRYERGADQHMPCLVVEKDWPEYAPTLAAILARADGVPAPREGLLPGLSWDEIAALERAPVQQVAPDSEASRRGFEHEVACDSALQHQEVPSNPDGIQPGEDSPVRMNPDTGMWDAPDDEQEVPREPVGERISDERILHLWDTHVGDPSAKYPLSDFDKLEFARAVLRAAVLAPSATRPTAGAYTWPPKACPCGSVQRDDCQDHGCKWERDPSLVPMDLRRAPSTTRQQEVGSGCARRQYFYKVDGCTARDARDPSCICWHDEGTGPLADDMAMAKNWRDAPATPSTPENAGGVGEVVSQTPPPLGTDGGTPQ